MSTTDLQALLMSEYPILKNLAMKLTMNSEDGKDLLQDTFLKALRHKDKFAEASNLRAWLCVIMKNTFINNYRRKSRANQFMVTVDDLMAVRPAKDYKSNNVEMDLYVNEISEKVEKLKSAYKIPFNRFNEGFRYQEISEELNIPVGTVKSRIFLARQEVMKELKAYAH